MTLAPTAANIIAVWEEASIAQHESGMGWYDEAHEIARDISGDIAWKGAGVLAALSPNKAWNMNIILARRAFRDGQASGSMGVACAKADQILGGAEPLSVMGNGLKTRNFYLNILNPSDPFPVTIDRHAYDVALGVRNAENKRLSLTQKRYDAFARVYREAAHTLGVLPQQVQAVTWETWRDKWAWRKVAAVA